MTGYPEAVAGRRAGAAVRRRRPRDRLRRRHRRRRAGEPGGRVRGAASATSTGSGRCCVPWPSRGASSAPTRFLEQSVSLGTAPTAAFTAPDARAPALQAGQPVPLRRAARPAAAALRLPRRLRLLPGHAPARLLEPHASPSPPGRPPSSSVAVADAAETRHRWGDTEPALVATRAVAAGEALDAGQRRRAALPVALSPRRRPRRAARRVGAGRRGAARGGRGRHAARRSGAAGGPGGRPAAGRRPWRRRADARTGCRCGRGDTGRRGRPRRRRPADGADRGAGGRLGRPSSRSPRPTHPRWPGPSPTASAVVVLRA